MTTAAFALVLCSAVVHATWNFQLKRAGHQIIFFWAMAAVGLVFFAVPAAAFAVIEDFGWEQAGFALGTVIFHSLYAVLLTRGYYLGDLSSVYPVARGIGPAFVPFLAVIFLSESVSGMAIAGIVLVVIGIYAVHIDARNVRSFASPFRALMTPAGRAAVMTGIVISCYSLWDKAGLDHDVHPMTLLGFTIVGNFVGLLPAMAFAVERPRLDQEVHSSWRGMFSAGLIAPIGYLLVLIALNTSRVSYIAPSREIGIVIGTAMGVLLLGEGVGLTRIWGAALIVAGAITLALAP